MNRVALVVTVALLGLSTLALVGEGAFFHPDEHSYAISVDAVSALSRGRVDEFCGLLIDPQVRPTTVLVKCLPVVAQILVFKLGGPTLNSTASDLIPQLFNLGVFALICLMGARIARRLAGGQTEAALLTLVLMLGSVNASGYVRHLLPYDLSVLFLLVSVHQFVCADRPLRLRDFFVQGLLLGLAYTSYSGYYFVVLLVPCMVLAGVAWRRWQQSVVAMCVSGLGFASVILAYESLRLLGAPSYLASSLYHSRTIVQGDFDHWFSFLWRYLWAVEPLWALAVGLAVGLVVYRVLRGTPVSASASLRGVLTFTLVCLGVQMLMCALGVFVWYGRLLHPIIVLMCVLVGAVVGPQVSEAYGERKSLILRVGVVLACLACVGNKVMFWMEASQVAYPRNVHSRLVGAGNPLRFANVYLAPSDTRVGVLPTDLYFVPMVNGPGCCRPTDTLGLVNFAYVYEYSTIGEARALESSAGDSIVFSGNHAANLTLYQFEGPTQADREALHSHPPTLAVYRRPAK